MIDLSTQRRLQIYLRRLERLSPWALLPALLVLMGFAFGVVSMSASSATACGQRTLNHWYDPYLLAVIATAGLGSGRGLGHLRRWLHEEPFPMHKGVRTEPWLQLFVTIFLALATGALVYESYGASPETSAEAITQYIRCAAASHLVLTGATAYLVFILIGSWIWYPTPGTDIPRPVAGQQPSSTSSPSPTQPLSVP